MIKTSSCKNCANDEVTFYSSMITLILSTKFDFCNSIEQYAKHLNNFYVENLIKEQHIFSNVVNAWLVKSEKRLFTYSYISISRLFKFSWCGVFQQLHSEVRNNFLSKSESSLLVLCWNYSHGAAAKHSNKRTIGQTRFGKWFHNWVKFICIHE